MEPWRKRRDRRLVETSKFYLFDIGVSNYLTSSVNLISEGTDLFGRAFEYFIINEVRAYLSYRMIDLPLCYWKTSSGFEVDLIVGDLQLALEIKATTEVKQEDLKGLRALKDEHSVKRCLLVSRHTKKRVTEDKIEMLHWADFCKLLWAGELV